ncbi:MAG TPA: signal peptidase I [Clostridiaceae bacterium]|nr:signal peptidase I [Clostridiaceae bacterium]
MSTSKSSGKAMEKVMKRISATTMVGVVILAVLLAGTRLVGLTPYSVISGSMEPAYRVGSLIYVQEVSPDAVEVGDPITFVFNENLVVATHRVVDIREDGQFVTKGDANSAVDGAPVHPNNLLGVPRFTLPYLGYVSVFLSTNYGKIFLLGVAALLLLSMVFPETEKPKHGKIPDKREVAD